MKFKVMVEGSESGAINENNGLRQGCTPAPVLFNIYFSEVVSQWQSICRDVEIPVRHSLGRKLVGDWTAKSRLKSSVITEKQFADDAAVFTTSQAGCADAAQKFIQCASRWSFTVSIPKTKGMFVNSPSNVHVSGEADDEVVSSFTYLGSVIYRDGLVSHYVLNRIAKASRALESLRVSIFENTTLPLR